MLQSLPGVHGARQRGVRLASFAALALFLSAGQLFGADWPMFLHDARHTGRSPYVGAQTSDLKWTLVTGFSNISVAVASSPVISADGTIYIGGLQNRMHAIAPDGTRKWTYTADSYVDSTAGIGRDGTVYFGSSDGNLYALNSEGALKWRFQTGGSAGGPVTLGRDGTVYIGSSNGFLNAVNPDGTLKWRKSGVGANDSNDSPAIGLDETIYDGTGGGCIDEPPICTSGFMNALTPDGTFKWRFPIGFTSASAPAVAFDGTIYFGTNAGYLYALRPSGALKWRKALGFYNTLAAPAIGWNGEVYIGVVDSILAIDRDGNELWRFPVGAGVFTAPTIGRDGTIYIGSDDFYFYAINPGGTLKWRHRMASGVYSSASIGSDGTVYVGCTGPPNAKVHGLCAFGPGPAQPSQSSGYPNDSGAEN